MQSFLEHCAEHIAKAYKDRLEATCVVIPTIRSGKVLEGFLRKYKVKKSPEIITIENFFQKMSGLDNVVSVMLLLELYDIFSKIDGNIKLEKFTGWGYILLKDFDAIDRNLVDAPRLFANLYDIKNLERWKLGEDRITPKITEYFKLWENLNETYQTFRARLLAQKQGYAGMMYRHLAENAEELLVHHPIYEQFVFIGFNALSNSEEKIFKTLLDHQKAEVIWDADDFYMQIDTENRAGHFLKRYREHFGSTNWRFQSSHLLHSAKDFTVISVPNASMQGKVANQLLKNWTILPKSGEGEVVLPATALVLADEHILMPVLHSLDELYKGLNITIGLSLKDSALFNLIDVLFEQYQLTIRDRETDQIKFSYRGIVKLLNHPFIRQYERKHCQFETEEGEEIAEGRSLILLLLNHIHRNNLIFMGKEDLTEMVFAESFIDRSADNEALIRYCERANEKLRPLFEVLLSRWKNTFEVIRCFEQLTSLLYPDENYFEAAYFREFEKIIKQLKFFVERKPKFIDIRTFKIFLYQAFREAKFDFDSQKDTEIQLMGIVETRNLDYENVIILSVNETVLPRAKKQNSFIPVDIAKAYNIPTYTEQDAVISYHFYRLLQRAKQIALVYVLPSDTYGGKEKSRFILQLQNDLAVQNPKIKIKELPAKFQLVEEKPDLPLIIPKTENEINKIKANFERGLTPSHINSFVTCSLQYYFSQVAEVGHSLSVEERMGADKLGSLVHEILEEIYRELAEVNPNIEILAIQSIFPSIEDRVDAKFNLDKYANYLITGQNYIVKQVTTKYLQEFLKQQIAEIADNRVPFQILTLENKDATEELASFSPTISASFMLDIAGESIPLTIKGITDRIDKVDTKVRIIDYKTGKVKTDDLKISNSELNRLIEDRKADKVRQLWLYKYIVAKRVREQGEFQVGEYRIQEHEDIRAGIYSFKNLEAGFMELNTKEKESIFPETLKEYVKVSEEYLTEIVRNMLNPAQAFEKTTDLDACKYCAYKDICGR